MDKNKKNVMLNYIYNLAYQLLVLITPFITAPYTARIFQADGIGMESYVSSLTYYFSLFGSLGIAIYGQREIARTRNDKAAMSQTFWELFFLKMCTTAISGIVYAIVISQMKENQLFFFVSALGLVLGVFDVSWFLMGIEKFNVLVLRSTIVKLVSIIILFALIKEKKQLLFYIIISTMTTFISNLSLWPYILKQVIKVDLKSLNIKKHLSETLVYFIPSIATSMYTVLDKVMLGLLTSNTVENGYYEQANKIVNMAKTILLSLNTVMLPRLSSLYAMGKKDEAQSAIISSLKFTMVIGLPLSAGLYCICANFIGWFLGEGFEGTISCIKITSWIIIIIGISNCLENQYIIPSGRKRQSNIIVIIGAIVNLVLNLLLIPKFGSKGAAVASIIAETIITIMYIRQCSNVISVSLIWKLSNKSLISVAIMMVITQSLQIIFQGVVLTILQVLIGGIIYLIIMLLLKDSTVTSFFKVLWQKTQNNRKYIG